MELILIDEFNRSNKSKTLNPMINAVDEENIIDIKLTPPVIIQNEEIINNSKKETVCNKIFNYLFKNDS